MRALNQIVIVGGGVGAAAAGEALRSEGYVGRIIQISDEKSLPYDRPPLSKDYLSGEMGFNDILLHPAEWYAEQKVALKRGQAVVSIDTDASTVTLENGQRVAYDRLLLANGARARLLPCVPPELTDKVHYVRTKQDAERIRSKVQVGKRAVMIGGGIIGIETAATLRQLGCEATVLEMAQRIVERLFPPELSQVIASIHINRGVKILTGVVIESIKSSTDGVVVTLTDGRVLPADILVIGIGIVPNVELGAEAGLDTQLNGIAVNGFGQTSCPSIYAVGDVTAFKLPSGSVRRWENWTHARKLAAVAVKHMLGKQPAPYFDYPWVWSDQYGMNIQVFGDPEGHVIDQVVMRGNLDSGRLTAFHLNRGRVIGGTTINDSRNKASVRKLIERGTIVPPELLVDTTLDLKKLVASL